MDIKPIRCSPVKLNVADVETAAKFSGAVYSDGIWWKELFKGFWWPFDIQEVFRVGIKPPFLKRFIGYQHLTRKEDGNCYLRFMRIEDLQGWGPEILEKKQRSVIRKSFENLNLRKIDKFVEKEAREAMFSWNNLVEWTGWRKKMQAKEFLKYWNSILKTPGATIIGAYKDEVLVGWIIGTLYSNGHCYPNRYVVHRKYFDFSPNDALIYCFLLSAKAMGAKVANFGLFIPEKASLDKFKEHLGFKRTSFPAYISLNPLAKLVIRILKPNQLDRITGWRSVYNQKDK